MTAPKEAKKESTVKVTTTDGRNRVLFEGPADEARKFVEDNFPRVHVEPGSGATPKADVEIDGATFNGDSWSDEKASK